MSNILHTLKDNVEHLAHDVINLAKHTVTDIKDIPEDIKVDEKIVGALHQLHGQVDSDMQNVSLNPEIQWDAVARDNNDLSEGEQKYLKARKSVMRQKFADYIGVDVNEVDEEDIPIIGVAASGGGYRAMLGVIGNMASAKTSGVWDLVSYYAGVSGSCWGIATYYTAAHCDHEGLIRHLRDNLTIGPASSASIHRILTAPDGVHQLLGGVEQKHRSGNTLTLWDFYGAFVTGALFLGQSPDSKYDPSYFKLTNQQKTIENGQQPFPIYASVRQDRPWKDWVDPEYPFPEDTDYSSKDSTDAQDAWFQWFEFNPYEVGNDELQSWIPAWGWGRHFEQNKSIEKDRIPEQNLCLEMGVWGSAPAGPLSSYLGTIQRNFPKGFILDEIVKASDAYAKKHPHDAEVFEDHHPVHAANNPNPVFHRTAPPYPPGILNSPRVHLIDAGMDNNMPLYVLAHPSRKIDIVIGLDASSDVMKNAFSRVADDFGARKGLKFTARDPSGTGTHAVTDEHPTAEDIEKLNGKLYAQVYDAVPTSPLGPDGKAQIGKFNTPQATSPWAFIYMPLITNPVDPEFDPTGNKKEFHYCSSYNLIWTPEQVDRLIKTSKANWDRSADTIKAVIKETWEKKRNARLGKTQ